MAPTRNNSTSTDRSLSPEDDYFNDLSQQPSRTSEHATSVDEGTESQQPKAKRIACVLCRKRKLKCDGAKPSCGTCTRLSHECSYDEVRRKSGPKRGYVKALEARLAQVETLLNKQDPPETSKKATPARRNGSATAGSQARAPINSPSEMSFPLESGTHLHYSPSIDASMNGGGLKRKATEDSSSREIINLGLEEPMPTPDVVQELNNLYFEKIHPSTPMIHRPRFLANMNLAPASRPPVCLRYAMWALAASVTDKYELMQDHFYQRARKYAERDEMRGHGENIITVGHVQAWFLIATYEFKMTYFPRAWMSTGRASRLALMMGMNRLDGQGLDVKQCLPPPKDWTDREERRRTFWMCFCEDRYASIGTGWPMTIDERDILSNLPAADEAFELSRPAPAMTLEQALNPDGAEQLSSMAGVIIMACLFGRNLTHLHRPSPDDNEGNLNGEFWRRHRSMDNILLNTSLALPDHLRLPSGLSDPKIVFLNMCIHTSTICLHQAAIFKADGNRLPANISSESKIRCITAAAEIASIMKMISHLDQSSANPFMTFCLYVAARVFVQYLKSRPSDAQVKSSLHFLLSAMQVMRKKNPLTESFLVQLDVDLESAGLEESRSLRVRLARMSAENAGVVDHCSMPHVRLGDDARPQPKRTRTFGDTGLAVHTSPNATAPGSADNGYPPGYAYGMQTGDQSQTSTMGLMPHTAGESYRVPVRIRTPSGNPSPQTVSEEAMDLTGDNDNSTPGSLQNYSTNSNTSYTPTSAKGIIWSNETFESTETRAVHIPSTTHSVSMTDLEQPTTGYSGSMFLGEMNDFTMPSWPGSHEGQNTMFTQGVPSTGFTPGPSSGTGFTPGASADILGMSDAEWRQMMDHGMLDMGWEAGFPATVQSVNETGEQQNSFIFK